MDTYGDLFEERNRLEQWLGIAGCDVTDAGTDFSTGECDLVYEPPEYPGRRVEVIVRPAGLPRTCPIHGEGAHLGALAARDRIIPDMLTGDGWAAVRRPWKTTDQPEPEPVILEAHGTVYLTQAAARQLACALMKWSQP